MRERTERHLEPLMMAAPVARRGLLAVAEGFHLLNLGDHRQLEFSLPVYDALYAWCKQEVASSSGDA